MGTYKCVCGKPDCNGTCEKAVVVRLASLLRSCKDDFMDTSIGTVRDYDKEGRSLICVGLEKVTGQQLTDKLVYMDDVRVKKEDVFSQVGGKNATVLLNTLTENQANEEIDELKKIVNKLNKKELVVNSIKNETLIGVRDEKLKPVAGDITIDKVEWIMDKDCKLDYYVTTSKIKQNNGARMRINVNEYGERFIVRNISGSTHNWEGNVDVIDILGSGFIRPILFDVGGSSIVVDRYQMYLINKDGTDRVIGEWSINSLRLYKEFSKLKDEVAEINEHSDFISRHVKYMIPFKLAEPKIVKL